MNGGCLLDTNLPSETLRASPHVKVIAWLEKQITESQFVSVVTIGELRRGATLLPPGVRRAKLERFMDVTVPSWFEDRVLPVTQAIAERWGVLDAARQLAGRPLNIADGLIAATALEHRLTLVTRNEKDFADLAVELLNPWEDR